MKVQLDTPNPALPLEALTQIDTNNVKALSQAINKTACQLLYQVESKTETALTSTSYKLIGEAVISTSGGMVDVDWYTSVAADVNVNFRVKLIIDEDEEKTREAKVKSDTGTFAAYVAVHYTEKMGAGRHRVQVYAKVDAGTAYYSTDSTSTEFCIKETLL